MGENKKMMQHTIHIQTKRGFIDITAEIEKIVRFSDVCDGICNVFVQHTSCSILITENADETVRHDLDAWMHSHVPEDNSLYRHNYEGEDDMPAHIKSILTNTSVTVPVSNNSLLLGTWQGIFLWEHRNNPHTRSIVVTIIGS